MKRMGRNPEKFGVLELFSAMARTNNFRLDRKEDLAQFAEMALKSLTSSQAAGTILHGKRVEAMFAYIAGALGRCQLIKAEDAGDMFVKGPPMQAPDYRVVLDDGTVMLIEVKNFHSPHLTKRFSLTQEYFDKLQRYAAAQGLPLKIALYFSKLNCWCLVSPDAFEKTRRGLEISVFTAMAKSEMVTLGDVLLATFPEIRLEMMGSAEEANEIDSEGQAVLVFRSGRIFCGGAELVEELDQRIAFYLMRFGRWTQTSHPVVEKNKLLGIVFTSRTDDVCEGQPFAIVGAMSSMISEAYSEYTVAEGKLVAVDVAIDPEDFILSIPHDFKSEHLPLWRFQIHPNADFKDLPTT
jgi:hypothetical protein